MTISAWLCLLCKEGLWVDIKKLVRQPQAYKCPEELFCQHPGCCHQANWPCPTSLLFAYWDRSFFFHCWLKGEGFSQELDLQRRHGWLLFLGVSFCAVQFGICPKNSSKFKTRGCEMWAFENIKTTPTINANWHSECISKNGAFKERWKSVFLLLRMEIMSMSSKLPFGGG